MYNNKLLLLLLAVLFYNNSFSQSSATIIAVGLQCELYDNPLGVDVSKPDLQYVLKALDKNDRGLYQTAYQILVASTPALLQQNKGDLWNSKKVMSDKMAFIKYSGKALQTSQRCWWKVRVWDQNGNTSHWSEAATWTMGIIKNEDWQAQWISAAGAEKFARTAFGYKAIAAQTTNAVKWVQVDLEQPYPISQISITPVFFEDRAGYGFPIHFKIEAANNPAFEQAIVVKDYTNIVFKNPGWKPANFTINNIAARYIRITANKLWGNNNNFQFALRQIAVFSSNTNIAAGKKITAFDSDENNGWTVNNITDADSNIASLPNYSSMLMRKAFQLRKKLLHAVIHVSGLSAYALTINGKKASDYLLTPGWTEYTKTILYDTYDVTSKLQDGENVIGIMLGNGMYNIQPDTVRYVKFLNAYGPIKTIAQLKITYTDGTEQIIATDTSWQVTPGPVTYSNMFGGEDYDANLEPAGWNNTFFKTSALWKPAQITNSAGGVLKGLSCAAPPIKIIETLTPIKVTQLKKHVWIYDFGQNASMMPELKITGNKNDYVRITPAELLDKAGYIDRTSATQDGVRPAWWQYTLSGKGITHWTPNFFYQGARYVQVELFAATENGPLPQVNSLNSLVVHSSATPIGKFSCANQLFNRTYNLVRWAQRSNMMSLMTDCPHREKMGWLEENHLNGPALRYNFNMAPLFRKNMNDMADAQLPNGFVPNIAPEYFIAGPSELTNGFRNSPEWGSAFIIVPWQQYLFSGDISLLERYYDKMKAYVSFLSGTAKNNIITTGLGDWYDIGPKAPWGSQLTPVPFTATAIYYYDNWILSRVAKLLDNEKDAANFSIAANNIRNSFNKEFFNTATGEYGTGSQTCNAMPLFLNLADSLKRATLLAAIIADIQKRGNGLTSGDVGYRFLLQALANENRSDIIFDMNNQSEKPGYGYQLKMGATSLTEKWDAGVGNFGSQNHFMLGQINEWFFNNLAGIKSDESGAGFKKIIIQPAILDSIKWVNASFNAASGYIACKWKKENKKVQLNITIPVNTKAIVYIPCNTEKEVTENGQSKFNNKTIKFIKYEKGCSIYEVLSGNYQFSVN